MLVFVCVVDAEVDVGVVAVVVAVDVWLLSLLLFGCWPLLFGCCCCC